jgi:hypothetical protein
MMATFFPTFFFPDIFPDIFPDFPDFSDLKGRPGMPLFDSASTEAVNPGSAALQGAKRGEIRSQRRARYISPGVKRQHRNNAGVGGWGGGVCGGGGGGGHA